jgi:poly(hydroxyalkanoate) granule-associated protein
MAAKKKNKKAAPAKSNGKEKSSDILRRPFLISVGALAMAEEAATDVIDSLLERGEKARKEGEKYMKKLEKKSSKATGKSKKSKKKASADEDLLQRALHWLNMPTRKEIETLSKKVDALSKKVA